MSDMLNSRSAVCRPTQPHISTVHLFGLLTAVSLALVWANNEFVMTIEVFHALIEHPQLSRQVDMRYETVSRMNVWGYAMAPFQTAFRIGFVALIVQLTCLLGGIDIAFRKLFRVSAIAFGAILFGSLLQIVWIARQPVAAVTRASLGIVPDSIAAWFAASSEAPSILYLLLSRVSITSLLWMLLLYWGLRETQRLRRAGAAAATAITWFIVSALQVGTSIFVRSLVG